jgi:hypothetical protein
MEVTQDEEPPDFDYTNYSGSSASNPAAPAISYLLWALVLGYGTASAFLFQDHGSGFLPNIFQRYQSFTYYSLFSLSEPGIGQR